MTKLEEAYQALQKQLNEFELANKEDVGRTRKSLPQSIPTGEEYRRMKEMLDKWKG